MVPFLRNCRLYWDAASQVKKWRPDSRRTNKGHCEKLQMFGGTAKNTEFLSAICLRQPRVLISTPLPCISGNLFRDKALLCRDKKAYCAEWSVDSSMRFICERLAAAKPQHSCFVSIQVDDKGRGREASKILHMKSPNGDVKNKWCPNHIIRWYKHVAPR